MREKQEKDILHRPIQINHLVLRNRIVMTAIHTGFSLAQETEFLAEISRGGAAVVTAVMGVSPEGTTGNMTLLSPQMTEGLAAMAHRVHQGGAHLFVQLFHAGRNGKLGGMADPLAVPVAPSALPSPIYRQQPRVLEAEELPRLAETFGQAAALCKASGVDGVEISCSVGYLLTQFISPLTNTRTDRYGGSLENRLRFPKEVIAQVRRAVGPDFPVTIRISSSDMLGGYGIADMQQFMKEAEPLLDGVNITGGWHESPVPQITMQVPKGGYASLSREIRRVLSIPVIVCNRINDRETALEILEGGYGDLVGCARPFLADSEFANRVLEEKSHRYCIGCNKGCIDRVLKQLPVSCVFNPKVELFGPEGQNPPIKGLTDSTLHPVELGKGKRAMVIGGGPAGMETAKQLALQGASVALYNDKAQLGGLMQVAGRSPNKKGILDNIQSMEAELNQAGVEIHTEYRVTPDFLKEELKRQSIDLVVVATGSVPLRPPIEGINQAHVVTAQEVLLAEEAQLKKWLPGSICIIGGGAVGLETGLFLTQKNLLRKESMDFLNRFAAPELKAQLKTSSGICIVEMAEKAGVDLGSLRHIVQKELAQADVSVRTGLKVTAIKENQVLTEETTPEKEPSVISIPADLVVLAIGYCSQGKELVDWLESSKAVPYLVIGDACKVGTIQTALRQASVALNKYLT